MSLSCMSGFPRKPLFVWFSEKTDGLMAQLLNVNGGETIWEGDNAVYPIFHNVRDTYHRKQTYLNCGNECNYRNRLRIERYGLILDIREDADLGHLGNASSGILAVVISIRVLARTSTESLVCQCLQMLRLFTRRFTRERERTLRVVKGPCRQNCKPYRTINSKY